MFDFCLIWFVALIGISLVYSVSHRLLFVFMVVYWLHRNKLSIQNLFKWAAVFGVSYQYHFAVSMWTNC
jgi:hypothetical protein